MSVNISAMNQYNTIDLRSAVATASPHELIAMLYDGALRALATAKGCIERKEIESRTKHLNKANSIILALQDFLDFEKGGEVSENLGALYDYMTRVIMQANMDQDADKIQEVIDLLLQLKIGWNGMPLDVKMNKKNA